MRKTLLLAAAVVVAAALARGARPARAADAPLDPAELLPGVETGQLSPAQREAGL